MGRKPIKVDKKSNLDYETEIAFRFEFPHNSFVEICRKRATDSTTGEVKVFRAFNRGYINRLGVDQYRWSINFPPEHEWEDFKKWFAEYIDQI